MEENDEEEDEDDENFRAILNDKRTYDYSTRRTAEKSTDHRGKVQR